MKVREQTSTQRYHVGKRQQTLRGCNLEENGRQNFEDSSSRGVPKQTTPAPVHVYRILFAFPLAPYQREDPRASGEFFPFLKSQNSQMMCNELLAAIKLQEYFIFFDDLNF